MSENNNVLLHSCCGICSGYPIEYLNNLGYSPVVFFFNPNIQPFEEYLKRLEAQKILCSQLDCELRIGDYDENIFEKAAFGLENQPEGGLRCHKCFEVRLNETAQKAKELGIKSFTTSLVISPHKNYKTISNIGKVIAKENNLEYLDIDFKKKDGFLKSNKLAKELNLYRQNYCGCKYGKR